MFRVFTIAFAWSKMMENIQKLLKVPFSSCVREAHVRLVKKNEEKSLLVSDWEWLPKAGWHPNVGCSFGILLNFFLHFSSCVSDEPLMRMMEKVLFHHFTMFFIVFDHANTCASMCLLVEIRNRQALKKNEPHLIMFYNKRHYNINEITQNLIATF